MTPEQWRLAQSFFLRALELPPAEVELFLAEIRSAEPEVAAKVQALLAEYQNNSNFLQDPVYRLSDLPSPPRMVFAPGSLVSGRFKILRRVGSGGMGDVYEAEDRELGRVALKTIRPDIARRPGIAAGFRTEVQLARRVASPHVCRIFDLFFSSADDEQDTVAFLTMQFIEGITLEERIARDGAIPHREAAQIARQLCDGLSAIHTAGIVHADLKGRNIMLSERDGQPLLVIMDFGIARELRSTHAAAAAGAPSRLPTTVAVTAGFIGTPDYMAPEQFEHGPLTPATDIYSLGVVLYEMVTSKRPFAAESVLATAVRRAKQPPAPSRIVSGLPRRWDAVIQCCLKYDAAERYQTASAVWRALSSGRFSQAHWEDRLRKLLQRPRLAAAWAAGCLALLIAGAWGIQSQRYRPPSAEAQKWFESGVAAVREGTYLKAANALEEAVKADDGFALAHARLADALNELDREGDAKDELLKASAPERTRNLPQIQRLYLSAIRAAVLQDTPGAIAAYRQVLAHLPKAEKPSGFVDLGRAYEKAGEVANAVAAYAQAVARDPDYPAAYVRLGVLEGRQDKWTGAEDALSHAEKLYRASSNAEGLAEVQYQRAYIADLAMELDKAEPCLNDALHIANEINSAPLQARVLSRLSTTKYLGGNTKEAVAFAQQAISLAHANQLSYWETDGRIRVANAYAYDPANGAAAEQYAEQAMQEAQRGKWHALEAHAAYTLAMIRIARGRTTNVLNLAESAYRYLKRASYFSDSTRALLLIIRIKTGAAESAEADRLCAEANGEARKFGMPSLMAQAEEAAGMLRFNGQQYPDALLHFQHAMALADSGKKTFLPYEQLWTAATLAALGRLPESENLLRDVHTAAATDVDLAQQLDETLVSVRLAQGRYRETLSLVTALRSRNLPPEDTFAAEVDGALAACLLNNAALARALSAAALTGAMKSGRKDDVAAARLACAEADLLSQSFQQAVVNASAAEQVFSAEGHQTFDWVALAVLSKSSKLAGDASAASVYASRARDLLKRLRDSWGDSTFAVYLQRADLKPFATDVSHA